MVTSSVPVPGFVLVPIIHSQMQMPFWSDIFDPRFWAWDSFPIGVIYLSVHSVLGIVLIVSFAVCPGVY